MTPHAPVPPFPPAAPDPLHPGDPGYEEGSRIWNAKTQGRPAAVIRCRTAEQVASAVRSLRSSDAPVAVRGGGHHVAGYASPDGAVVLDLSSMNSIVVDPVARTAVIGPGVRARELNAATQRHGLVTTAAPVTTCGMAGYTLGGGLGWVSRRYGLASDNLLSAEVVLADGRIVRASSEEHPDLFWALRGGGGNFGVVTRFELRLHPLEPEVFSGQLTFRMADAPAVLRAWRTVMAGAPDEFSCMPVLFQMPPLPQVAPADHGTTVLALVPFHPDVAAGADLIRPLRSAAPPLVDAVGAARYETLLMELDEMYRAGDRNAYATSFLDDLPDAAIDAFVAAAAPVPSPFSSIFIEWLGGAVSRQPVDATAFPHRERRICLTAVPKWDDPAADERMLAWAAGVRQAVMPFSAPGAYVNYLGADLDPSASPDELSRRAYGRSYDRLSRIKAVWDPDNVFRANHNVPPLRDGTAPVSKT